MIYYYDDVIRVLCVLFCFFLFLGRGAIGKLLFRFYLSICSWFWFFFVRVRIDILYYYYRAVFILSCLVTEKFVLGLFLALFDEDEPLCRLFFFFFLLWVG